MNEGLRTWLDNQPDQQALQAQTDWQSLYALHQWAKIFTIVLLWITYVYDSDKIHISSKTFISTIIPNKIASHIQVPSFRYSSQTRETLAPSKPKEPHK